MRISFFRPASALNSKPEKPLDLIYSFFAPFLLRSYIHPQLAPSFLWSRDCAKQANGKQPKYMLSGKAFPIRMGRREGDGKRGLHHKKGNARDKYLWLEGQYFIALLLIQYNMDPNITIQLYLTHSGWMEHFAIPLRHYPLLHYPASYSWTESPCHIKCPCSIQCTYTMSIIGFPSPMLDTHSPFSLSCPSPPCCLSKWN